MKRHLTAAAAIGLSAALISGSPTATARPVDTTEVSPNKIDALLLSARELSRGFGVTMVEDGSSKTPNRPWSLDKRECSELFGASRNTFGSSYQAYLDTHHVDDPDEVNIEVFQKAAVYSDADTPQQAFRDNYTSALRNQCDNAVVHNQGDPDRVDWGVRIGQLNRDHIQSRVSLLVDGEPVGISCATDTRPTGNVLLSVMVCGNGDGTSSAEAIAEDITYKIAGM